MRGAIPAAPGLAGGDGAADRGGSQAFHGAIKMANKPVELQDVGFNWSGVDHHLVSVHGTYEIAGPHIFEGSKLTILVQLADSERGEAVLRLDEALHATLLALVEETRPREG